MALTTISNGDVPDATVLMANFNALAGGQVLKVDTYANLKIAAAAAPTTPFIGLASDIKAAVIYWGDATVGDAGFIIIGGAAAGPSADLPTERG